MSLVFSGVSFAYPGSEPLFSDITFTVRPGERVALVGPNGSGKTTLLRIAAGLQPAAGSVSCPAARWYLPQNALCQPGEPVAELLGVARKLAALHGHRVRARYGGRFLGARRRLGRRGAARCRARPLGNRFDPPRPAVPYVERRRAHARPAGRGGAVGRPRGAARRARATTSMPVRGRCCTTTSAGAARPC